MLVLKVAIPPLRVPVPMGEPPSRKATLPVGVPAPGATTVTVAVRVTACPNTEGFWEEVTVVLLSALVTTWGFPVRLPALPLRFPSPL